MDKQKLQMLLDRLLEGSEKRELNWKSTGNPLTFLLTLKDSSISISNEMTHFEFTFRNERGEVVERTDVSNMDELFYKKASNLFHLALKKATNADDFIDRIIEQLKPDSIAA